MNEGNPGSFASSVLRILNEYLEVPAAAPVTPVAPPAAMPTLIPIHRLYSAITGEHLDSLSPDEGEGVGFSPEGMEFQAFDASSGGVPFYRCHTTKKHFLSQDQACEGQIVESTQPMGCFSADGTLPNSQPIHRLYDAVTGDHLMSFDATEGAPNDAPASMPWGYVVPAPSP